MGSALCWELKVHPLTAACCHIVRLKVQTSPDSRLETYLDLCEIMAAAVTQWRRFLHPGLVWTKLYK